MNTHNITAVHAQLKAVLHRLKVAKQNYEFTQSLEHAKQITRYTEHLAILSAWLHCQLWAIGATKTPPKDKHYTLAALEVALASR
jgi:hypothetical protein